MSSRGLGIALAILCVVVAPACNRRKPNTIPQPAPPPVEAPPSATTTPPPAPPRGPERVEDRQPVAGLTEEGIDSRSLDELNRNSPLKPAFFLLDSSDLDDAGRSIVTSNVEILKKNGWVVTIEGHCDERGTAEYNLALGERRATAVKTYMVSLGIAPDRLRTVSYGKEFPFDQGHSEDAWSKNRRAHFVITSK